MNETESNGGEGELLEGYLVAGELDAEHGRQKLMESFNKPTRLKLLTGVVKDYERMRRVGALISQNAAARVLNVSGTQVRRLVEEGKLVYLEFPTLKDSGVTIASLEALRKQRAKEGLGDAASALRDLQRETQTNKETKL